MDTMLKKFGGWIICLGVISQAAWANEPHWETKEEPLIVSELDRDGEAWVIAALPLESGSSVAITDVPPPEATLEYEGKQGTGTASVWSVGFGPHYLLAYGNFMLIRGPKICFEGTENKCEIEGLVFDASLGVLGASVSIGAGSVEVSSAGGRDEWRSGSVIKLSAVQTWDGKSTFVGPVFSLRSRTGYSGADLGVMVRVRGDGFLALFPNMAMVWSF